jgi:hypothetical protein
VNQALKLSTKRCEPEFGVNQQVGLPQSGLANQTNDKPEPT